MKKMLIQVAKAMPPLRAMLKSVRRSMRLTDAKRTLLLCFDEHFDKDAVINDYAISIRITDRHFNQVRLIEDVLMHLSSWQVQGALVECGVFTGGASAYMLRAALRHNSLRAVRAYWGFDSFEGMPHATQEDGDHAAGWLTSLDKNLKAAQALDGGLIGTNVNVADKAAVTRLLLDTGYPKEQVNLVEGWFQDTLMPHRERIGDIALLRVDGDFYESTKVCLDTLGPRVVCGGAIIIDDYGSFPGCKKAVDEYVVNTPGISKPLRYDAHQALLIKVD